MAALSHLVLDLALALVLRIGRCSHLKEERCSRINGQSVAWCGGGAQVSHRKQYTGYENVQRQIVMVAAVAGQILKCGAPPPSPPAVSPLLPLQLALRPLPLVSLPRFFLPTPLRRHMGCSVAVQLNPVHPA